MSAANESDLWAKWHDRRVQGWFEGGLPEPERLLKRAATQSEWFRPPGAEGFSAG